MQLATFQEDRPCKVPRHDPLPCPSMHSGSMDEDCKFTHLVSAPPQLLSWMLPLRPPNPRQLGAPMPAPSLTPLGFPALIPVIHCWVDNPLHAPEGSIPIEDGQLDFHVHARYVFATSHMSPDGVPNFQTTLVRSRRFLSLEAIAARKIGGRLPLVGLVLGGRNGVLISLTRDPHMQSEVDTLLNAPDKTRFARGYADHICFTPLALHGTLYSCALEQWDNLQMNTSPTCRPKPLPTTHPTIWKRWL
jgi:hypothetical protein